MRRGVLRGGGALGGGLERSGREEEEEEEEEEIMKEERGAYVYIQLPMKPIVDPQPIRQLPRRQQRLIQHRRQKHRQRVVVPVPGNLNRHLHPAILAPSSPSPSPSPFPLFPLLIHIPPPNTRTQTLLSRPPTHTIISHPRHLDLRLHAHDRLSAIREAYPRTAVRAGQDICFGDEGTELRRGAGIGTDGRVEGEGGV